MFNKHILLVLDNIKIQINTTFSKLSNFYNNYFYNNEHNMTLLLINY